MPYRRLPKTDQSRIKSLKAIVNSGEWNATDNPISLNIIAKARNLLERIESAHVHYKECYSNQSGTSRQHKENVKNARMYVSHFIQVLNMSMVRREIKPTRKDLYGLPSYKAVPNLFSEKDLLFWGKKIIEGEQKRISLGERALFNPTISKVKVYYDIFAESYDRQKSNGAITKRSLEIVSSMREEADEIILDAWNQIEKYFSDIENQDIRLDRCREYGVIYYYRKGEK